LTCTDYRLQIETYLKAYICQWGLSVIDFDDRNCYRVSTGSVVLRRRSLRVGVDYTLLLGSIAEGTSKAESPVYTQFRPWPLSQFDRFGLTGFVSKHIWNLPFTRLHTRACRSHHRRTACQCRTKRSRHPELVSSSSISHKLTLPSFHFIPSSIQKWTIVTAA